MKRFYEKCMNNLRYGGLKKEEYQEIEQIFLTAAGFEIALNHHKAKQWKGNSSNHIKYIADGG